MKRNDYLHMTERLRAKPSLIHWTGFAYEAILVLTGIAYACTVAVLIASHEGGAAFKAIAVPLVGYMLTHLASQIVDAPRPYEAFGVDPVIREAKSGRSFPSMQVFFVFVVGMVFLGCLPSPVPGAVVLVFGCFLGTIQVVTGLRYPRDVIGGAIAGIAFGVAGFFV